MMWFYECENCGCCLDPGEGRICEDCLVTMRLGDWIELYNEYQAGNDLAGC